MSCLNHRVAAECIRIGKRRRFKQSELVLKFGLENEAYVHNLVDGFVRKGAIEVVMNYKGFGPEGTRRDRLLKNVDFAPLQRLLAPRQRKDTGWDRAWNAMRVMGRFTIADIAELAAITTSSVAVFFSRLSKEGWLRNDGARINRLWFFIRKPRIQRPIITKRRVD